MEHDFSTAAAALAEQLALASYDDTDHPPLLSVPPAGAPVLPSSCAIPDADILARMAAGLDPDSAEEFLARTRLEASRLPAVVLAPRSRFLDNDDLVGRKRARKVPADWAVPIAAPKPRSAEFEFDDAQRDIAIEAFYRARSVLENWELHFGLNPALKGKLKTVEFPTRQERLQWMEFCLGNEMDSYGTPPLLHVLLQMDHVVSVRVLRCMTKACELDGVFSDRRIAWMFALLSRIDDEAATVEVMAMFSNLHRLACRSRANYKGHPDDELLKGLNVLIVILEDYFGQGEVDDDENADNTDE